MESFPIFTSIFMKNLPLIDLLFFRVLEKDQFHKACVPLYVSTLVHLNKVTRMSTQAKMYREIIKSNTIRKCELFIKRAFRDSSHSGQAVSSRCSKLNFYFNKKKTSLILIQFFSLKKKKISWFAVGCYYFLIGNMDPARKFFL